MKVAIRVDGNVEIGVGHVFRCVTLADRLLDYGIKSTFFVRNITENLLQLLKAKFEVIVLDCVDNAFEPENEYARWLGVSQKIDAEEFILNASLKNFHCVIVDHYGIDRIWERLVQDYFGFILVVDDLANRKHFCNLLLDQSIGRHSACYSNLVPPSCRLLIGPKFALLRDEFAQDLGDTPKKYQILINFGGADKDNYTEHVLCLLADYAYKNNYSIKIIIGKDYPFKNDLIQKISNLKLSVKLVESPQNFVKEVCECSIAVGAGGVSLLERSALGLPSIVYAIADNQRDICAEYARINLGSLIRRDQKDEADTLKKLIHELLRPEVLSYKEKINKEAINVHGTEIVVAEVLEYLKFITLHEATMDDARFIYDCRYEETDTSLYLNPKIPNLTMHITWLSGALSSDRCEHVIFRIGSKRFGYVRLDTHRQCIEVSIYLHAKYRGKGLAAIMLNEICRRKRDKKLIAFVHCNNRTSLRIFQNCGFKVCIEEDQFLRLEY